MKRPVRVYAVIMTLVLLFSAINLHKIDNVFLRILLLGGLSWSIYSICFVALIKIVIIKSGDKND